MGITRGVWSPCWNFNNPASPLSSGLPALYLFSAPVVFFSWIHSMGGFSSQWQWPYEKLKGGLNRGATGVYFWNQARPSPLLHFCLFLATGWFGWGGWLRSKSPRRQSIRIRIRERVCGVAWERGRAKE